MNVADVLKSLLDLGRSYVLKPANGYRLAVVLVVTYLGIQGVKLVSPWIRFEFTLLGADSVPGAIVVVMVTMALIVAQYLKDHRKDRSGQLFLNAFRETLRLRELGFSLKEIESQRFLEPDLISAIYDAAERHSTPIPVRAWTVSKLRSIVGSEEFSSLLIKTIPDMVASESIVGTFIENWLLDDTFKEQFETIDEVTSWITKQTKEQ